MYPTLDLRIVEECCIVYFCLRATEDDNDEKNKMLERNGTKDVICNANYASFCCLMIFCLPGK